jgi:hypothetical protein
MGLPLARVKRFKGSETIKSANRKQRGAKMLKGECKKKGRQDAKGRVKKERAPRIMGMGNVIRGEAGPCKET